MLPKFYSTIYIFLCFVFLFSFPPIPKDNPLKKKNAYLSYCLGGGKLTPVIIRFVAVESVNLISQMVSSGQSSAPWSGLVTAHSHQASISSIMTLKPLSHCLVCLLSHSAGDLRQPEPHPPFTWTLLFSH